MSEIASKVRAELAAALHDYETGDRVAAIERFRRAAELRPGCLPLGDLRSLRASLTSLCADLPDNLTARLALADALTALGQDARGLYVSIIRDARPIDKFATLNASRAPFDAPEVRKLAWQSVDLGKEFIEGNRKDSRQLARETLMLHWPDLTGKAVLDIGTFGGWFAFEAERRGAAAVTACEYYSWITNFDELNH